MTADDARGPRASPAGTRRHRTGSARWFVLAASSLVALLMLAPLLVMLLNAFKSPGDYSRHGPLRLPHELYFDGLKDFWNRVDFAQKLLELDASSPARVAVARRRCCRCSTRTRWASAGSGAGSGSSVLFLLANMLPQEALVYPLYYLAKHVGLYDTRLVVIIIFTVIQSAFGTYLLSSVLGDVPARSCSRPPRSTAPAGGTVLWRVVVPIVRPTLACCSSSSSSGPGTSSSCRWSS